MAGKVYDRQQLVVDRDPNKQLAAEVGRLPKIDPAKMLEDLIKWFEDMGFDAIEAATGVDLRFVADILYKLQQFVGIDDWADLANPIAIWTNIIQNVLRPGGLINLDFLDDLIGGGGASVTLPVTLPFTLPTEASATAWFFTNLKKFLADIDFTSPNFNPADALATFVQLALLPLNLLAKLIGGFIPTGQIPGLDASKIISGLFSPAMVSGLTSFLTNIENALKSIPGGGLLAGVVGFWADFVNSILGQGPNAITAYTPENAAVANVQGQVNFLLADNDPSTSGFFEGFNTPPTINTTWTNVFGPVDCIHTDGVFWHPTGYNCKRYNAARPGTTHWQAQGSIAYVANHGGLAGRILIGFDPTNWTARYPALEVLSGGGSGAGDGVSIVSLAGNPNSVANANIGRQVHASKTYGVFTIKNGDVFAIEVNEALKKYWVYLNPGPGSEPILEYDDSVANLFTRGLNHRDVAYQINVNNVADPFQGAGWDNASAFDRLT